MPDQIKLLQQYQKFIFWVELAGLLHDIGKFQNSFIDYRKKYQTCGGKDPHQMDFLGEEPELDHLLKNEEFNSLHSLFRKSLTILSGYQEITSYLGNKTVKIGESIADLVKLHINPENSELGRMLKASDAKDSAEDRNNPLLVNEQNQAETIYKSSVFGYETALDANLDELREQLYQSLQKLLCVVWEKPTTDLRENVHKAVRIAFSQGLSDTCRPANDIALWEHCYATATLFKVLIASFILYGEKQLGFDQVKFSLWGIGWDGLAFYSSGQRVGDVVGRKAIIQKLKRKIREKVEWDFGLGNAIYDDDNGIYFIIPEVKGDKSTWVAEIIRSIIEVNKEVTEDELPIYFSEPKNTTLMVPIITIIEELRQKMPYPRCLQSEEIQELKWVSDWSGDAEKVVCPICRKRPIPRAKSICRKCEKIRKQRYRPPIEDALESLETAYHSEIVLGNSGKSSRLALIVARFDLKNWLDGTMLYSLFVKEASSLDAALRHLDKIKDESIRATDQKRMEILRKEGIDLEAFSFNYEEINRMVELCRNPNGKEDLARALLYLFDRHAVKWDEISVPPKWNYNDEILNELKTMGKDVTLANYLVTKNHTPSRLLRIWNGTRDFFIEQSRLLRKECKDDQGRIRLVVTGEAPENTILKGAVKLSDQTNLPIEVVKEGDTMVLIDRRSQPSIDWNGAIFELTAEEFIKGKQAYSLTVTGMSLEDIVRARTITASPDLFLAVVPADKALEICELIIRNYQKEFGKVYGRLPLSIGVIYFNPQMPMFVTIDGARRMIKNFERLSRAYEQARIAKITRTGETMELHLSLTSGSWSRNIELSLPTILGNGDEDYFHPYFFIESGEDITGRKSYFDTLAGKVVHYLDLKEGDRIIFHPNFFDFEFLDSTTRRFDLSGVADPDKKRSSGPDQRQTRPLFLEDLEQCIGRLWKILKDCKGMTDSKVRNLASLFHAWEAWRENENGDDICSSFIETALIKDLPDVDQSFITTLLREGLLFDILELHLEILKERIAK